MMFTELQNRFNSVDRIAEYTSRIEHEPEWECEQDQTKLLNWPSEGNQMCQFVLYLFISLVFFRVTCIFCIWYHDI